MLLSLLLAVTIESPRYAVQAVQPLRALTALETSEGLQSAYARDAQYEYLALPDGLYRGALLRDPGQPLERIAFAGETVYTVAVNDGKLYVLKGRGSSAHSPDHTLVRSLDHGATFTPLDEGLLDCGVPPCAYLAGDDIAFAENRIFMNAGGNVVVTGDDGVTWNVLYGLTDDGKPTGQLCPVEFLRVGDRLLLGGECPLDIAWLSSGRMRPDLLGWAEEPQPVDTPWLENRNVQFIRHLGGETFLVSVEGGILKSTDNGVTFRWVLYHHIEDSEVYPYIWELLAPPELPGLLVVGGFDKATAHAYLAYSADNGETWTNASVLLGATLENSAVTMLAQDRDGRLLAVVLDDGRFSLAEITVGEAKSKRRAVGR